MPRRSFTAFAIVALATVAAPAPAHDPALQTSRVDVAHAFIRFERAYLESDTRGDRLARVNREFDRLTRSIFFDRIDDALRRLEVLSHALATRGPLDGAAPVFIARVNPPVASHGANERAALVVQSLDPLPGARPGPGSAVVTLQSSDGAVAWRGEAPFERDGADRVTVRLDLPEARSLPTGRLAVEFEAPGRPGPVRIGAFAVVPRPLSETRAEAERLLDDAEHRAAADPRDLAICRARAALLRDDAPATSLAHSLADPAQLALEVADEAAALANSKRPYRLRPGDLWRPIELNGIAVPMRLHAPPTATATGEPMPLVVALHGAGVDENMFLDAYGAGLIKSIADERGFLVAAPLTYPFMASVFNLNALIDDLATDYPIDRSRVYLIGHSLGAIAACGFVSAPDSPVAAAVCIAGFRPLVGAATTPPVLVVAAALDTIFPVERMQSAVEDARRAGLPVESVVVADQGHTLIVPEALPAAVDFLLRHRLDH